MDSDSPRPERTKALAAALDLQAGGISVIPIRTDGSKAPAILTWDQFQSRIASDIEVREWFNCRALVGVAIVCGAVSGNLASVDFEYSDFFAQVAELVEAEEPGLIGNLPLVSTPGKSGFPGRHLYLRGASSIPTGKLAHLLPEEAMKRTSDPKKTTAIEIKGQGGYVLAPGCPAECHESRRLYTHIGGPFIEDTPILMQAQIDLLLECCRAVTQVPIVQTSYRGAPNPKTSLPGDEERPGAIFNRLGDWSAILTPHGWRVICIKNGVTYWCRPGKAKGVSATSGHCSSPLSGDLLCVFSSNAAPLDIPPGSSWHCFNKFAAHALLNHSGNFSQAAVDLTKQGYGTDAAIREIDQRAKSIAAKLDVIGKSRSEVEAEVLDKLRDIARKQNSDVTEEEIRLAAERAARDRVEDDPKALEQQAVREIEESASQPNPAWKLVIIESDPRSYLLKSPFWSQKPLLAPTGGFIKLETVRELSNWSNIFSAAAEQGETSIPLKLNGWRRLLERLFQQAGRQATVLEEKRPMVVLEWLWSKLSRPRIPKIQENGELALGSGQPVQLPDGSVLVKVPWLCLQAKGEADGITRSEITKAMKECKMFAARHQGTRWWELTKAMSAKLADKVHDGLQEAAIEKIAGKQEENL